MNLASTLRLLLSALLVVGCSSKRLPPGTPGPEYEQRQVAPWPPVSASGPSPVEPAGALPAEPPPGLTGPDAGTDAADTPLPPAPDAGVER